MGALLLMRPSSNTRILSAPTTVDRRWAIMITVRPRVSSENAFWISASFSGSAKAVASSRTTMGASFRMALARQCAAARRRRGRSPRSRSGCPCPGAASPECPRTGRPSAPRAPAPGGVGAGSPGHFQDRGFEQTAVLEHKGDLVHEHMGSICRTSTPPTFTAPEAASQKRGIRLAA